jgi:hypothetical protein
MSQVLFSHHGLKSTKSQEDLLFTFSTSSVTKKSNNSIMISLLLQDTKISSWKEIVKNNSDQTIKKDMSTRTVFILNTLKSKVKRKLNKTWEEINLPEDQIW